MVRMYTSVKGINIELDSGVCLYCLSSIEERVLNEALWIVNNKCSIRSASKELLISKSTIHYDMKYRLSKLSTILYDEVKATLKKNKERRK